MFKNSLQKTYGSFTVKSGKLIVTDPCYNLDLCSENVLENAKNGKWNSVFSTENTSWGRRVVELRAFHSENIDSANDNYTYWKCAPFQVGVDSGQAGIFDFDSYPVGGEDRDYDDETSFYRIICDMTCSDEQGGCIEFGVTTSSGFGDGTYHCYYAENDGQVVAVKVIFIEDEESTEYDSYDDDEYEVEKDED